MTTRTRIKLALIITLLLSADDAWTDPFFSVGMALRWNESPTDRSGQILEALYNGQYAKALARADDYIALSPGDPLALLMRARVLREALSDQDDNKDLIKRSAEPIYEDLKRAISLCDEALTDADVDPKWHFYRGWAYMFKAQISALAGSYWSAGRAAKKGKKDLDEFLKADPGDADAQGILGTFLYFADTLPSAVKIIKSFFLIPGGDKERGLKLLNYASSHEGLLSVDHKIILSAIYTLFEGRFEDGIKSFNSLVSRYPYYLRLIEPLGIIAAFSPADIRDFQAVESASLDRHMNAFAGEVARETLQRLRYHRSYSYMFFSSPDEAIMEFKAIVAARPSRPDWLAPLSLINIGVVYANGGNPDEARQAFEAVRADGSMHRFHSVAEKMLDRLDEIHCTPRDKYSELAGAIYDKRMEAASRLLSGYEQEYGGAIQYCFYKGELNLLIGKINEAEKAYRKALAKNLPEASQVYQLFSAVRLAEILGMQRKYKAAEQMLDKALEYYHKEFFVDMLIKGRKRFYEELASKKSANPPTLILNGMGSPFPRPVPGHEPATGRLDFLSN